MLPGWKLMAASLSRADIVEALQYFYCLIAFSWAEDSRESNEGQDALHDVQIISPVRNAVCEERFSESQVIAARWPERSSKMPLCGASDERKFSRAGADAVAEGMNEVMKQQLASAAR